MMSKKSPQLRFEGFTDDWEERKIKDIFKITRGQVLAATETSEEKSDISPFPVYSSQTKNNGLMGYYKDYLFDTAITWTTDGANAGTVSYRSGRFYSTNVNGVLISDKGYTNKAISEILNLEAWKWVSHVGNPKLMNNVMGDISIMIPSSFEEQDRLSDFLNQLDDTIALHQRKLDLLKEQKKGYLQKMFPKNGEKVPELRFAGFADDWELRKSKELCTISTGKGNTQDKVDDGAYPFYVRSATIEKSDEYLYDQEAVLTVGDGVGTGKVYHYVNGKYNLHQRVYRMYDFKDVSAKYFYYYFSKNFYKRVMSMTAKTSVDSVRMEMIADMNIVFPSVKEQENIVELFSNLDNTIALHQRKLDLLKEQKKGFLQKMFV